MCEQPSLIPRLERGTNIQTLDQLRSRPLPLTQPWSHYDLAKTMTGQLTDIDYTVWAVSGNDIWFSGIVVTKVPIDGTAKQLRHVFGVSNDYMGGHASLFFAGEADAEDSGRLMFYGMIGARSHKHRWETLPAYMRKVLITAGVESSHRRKEFHLKMANVVLERGWAENLIALTVKRKLLEPADLVSMMPLGRHANLEALWQGLVDGVAYRKHLNPRPFIRNTIALNELFCKACEIPGDEWLESSRL